DRALRMHRLRRDDPELARRDRGRIGRRARVADDVAGTRQTRAVGVDRVDVLAREVVAPDLDLFEPGKIGGEKRTDRSAGDDADPQPVASWPRSRVRRIRVSQPRENSLPPVRPLGRRTSTSAMTALSTTMRDPSGRLTECPRNVRPFSASARIESSRLTKSAPTTAPQRLPAPPMTSIASVMNVRSR